MARWLGVVILFVFVGCPEQAEPPAEPPQSSAEQRKAQVDLETRMAEGGEALQVEDSGD